MIAIKSARGSGNLRLFLFRQGKIPLFARRLLDYPSHMGYIRNHHMTALSNRMGGVRFPGCHSQTHIHGAILTRQGKSVKKSHSAHKDQLHKTRKRSGTGGRRRSGKHRGIRFLRFLLILLLCIGGGLLAAAGHGIPSGQ